MLSRAPELSERVETLVFRKQKVEHEGRKRGGRIDAGETARGLEALVGEVGSGGAQRLAAGLGQRGRWFAKALQRLRGVHRHGNADITECDSQGRDGGAGGGRVLGILVSRDGP